MHFDPEEFGKAMGAATSAAIKAALSPVLEQIEQLKAVVAAIPTTGPKPEPVVLPDIGALVAEAVKSAVAALPAAPEPLALAGAMIDRDGALLITLSSGEVKNLGRVVGVDGKDGMSLESFDIEYIPEESAFEVRAACAGRTKTAKAPIPGMRPAGYWRDQVKAKAGEVWTYQGSAWAAKVDTSAEPGPQSPEWVLLARKGKDGETIVREKRPAPASIKLEA